MGKLSFYKHVKSGLNPVLFFSLSGTEDPPAVCEISPLVSYFGEVRLIV